MLRSGFSADQCRTLNSPLDPNSCWVGNSEGVSDSIPDTGRVWNVELTQLDMLIASWSSATQEAQQHVKKVKTETNLLLSQLSRARKGADGPEGASWCGCGAHPAVCPEDFAFFSICKLLWENLLLWKVRFSFICTSLLHVRRICPPPGCYGLLNSPVCIILLVNL